MAQPNSVVPNEARLRLAFVVDPLVQLKAWKDSSVAMMRAAARRGHEVYAIDSATLGWLGQRDCPGGVFATAVHLILQDEDTNWYREMQRETMPLAAFDAVLMRKDPPFDMEYITATWLLEQAEAEGVRVFNRPCALRDHSEKLAIAEFAEFAPETLVSREEDALRAFIDEIGDTVLKPLDGMGGSEVFRVRHDDPNRNVIVETLTRHGARTIMAQRFLPAISEGDKRILLIAGKPVPWSLARIPIAGESRGNLAVGATGVARELTPRDREIAEALGPVLWDRGLLFVGIDVIGDHLTEINVTSPTCMVEIHEQTGFDAADTFIAALEDECAAC